MAREWGVDIGLVRAAAPVIDGHAEALAASLRNLIGDAITHCPSGVVVHELALDDTGRTLAVDDTGLGEPLGQAGRKHDRENAQDAEAASAAARRPQVQDAWWQVLGVRVDSSSEEIRRAYRRAIFSTHPDRHPDAPAHERNMLERRAQALNDAWREARSVRGGNAL
jgi:hypothetical protein